MIPKAVEEFFSVLGHFAPEGEHELRETYQVCALFVEYIEDHIDFGVCYIDSLIFYYLLELLVI